jgi:hypothetical protein
LVNVLSTWTFVCLNDGSGCGVLYTNNLLTYVPDGSVAPFLVVHSHVTICWLSMCTLSSCVFRTSTERVVGLLSLSTGVTSLQLCKWAVVPHIVGQGPQPLAASVACCRYRYSPPAALHSNPPVHALGIATYVCEGSFVSAATLTPTQLVAQCNSSLATSRALFARFRDMAAATGLGVVMYEVCHVSRVLLFSDCVPLLLFFPYA